MTLTQAKVWILRLYFNSVIEAGQPQATPKAVPKAKLIADKMDDDIARIFASKIDRAIVAHGHGSLTSYKPVPMPRDRCVVTFTPPGGVIYSNQTRALMQEFHSGSFPFKAAKGHPAGEFAEQLHLRYNNDQSPAYTTTTTDHNGYESQSRFVLGIYLWERGEELQLLGSAKEGNPQGGRHDQFSLEDIMEIAKERNIKHVIIMGCKCEPM